MSRAVHTIMAPAAVGPYSQAMKVGSAMYLSGQLGLNPETGTFDSDDIRVQTKQSLCNIQAILKEAGYSMDDVVKTTVYMKDMGEFLAMNEVYAAFFDQPYPARSAVQVAALPKDGRVEIEVIALKRRKTVRKIVSEEKKKK